MYWFTLPADISNFSPEFTQHAFITSLKLDLTPVTHIVRPTRPGWPEARIWWGNDALLSTVTHRAALVSHENTWKKTVITIAMNLHKDV